jgi:hypothetical protein
LYVAGGVTSAGGTTTHNIARWNGSAWSDVGGGTNGYVFGLSVYDDGSGSALYAGGTFSMIGGHPASLVARWNGSSWSALGAGLGQGNVNAFLPFNDGSGLALLATGAFTLSGNAGFAKWNGSAWIPFGSGLGTGGNAMCVFDGGSGPALYATFDAYTGSEPTGIGVWSQSAWHQVGPQGNGITHGSVASLAVMGAGDQAVIYAGGTFADAGSAVTAHVARFDGTSWSGLANSCNGTVMALCAFDDGTGPAMYAGGDFTQIGGTVTGYIAKWNGSGWVSIGGVDLGDAVTALVSGDIGEGPSLYVGGQFTQVGGINTSQIARWDGSSWHALGGGLSSSYHLLELCICNDGSGPALFARVQYQVVSFIFYSILRWSGSSWSLIAQIGADQTYNIRFDSMCGFHDAHGPVLCVGGNFSSIGNVTGLQNLAAWNGTTWTGIANDSSSELTYLVAYDDGSGNGARLYAADPQDVMRLDGTQWSFLGTASTLQGQGGVNAMSVFDDHSGTGPALYVAGSFDSVDGIPSSMIGDWHGCGHSGVPICFGDGSGAACPCANFGAGGHGCDNSAATGGAILDAAGSASLAFDSLVLTSSGELPSVLSIFLQGSAQIAPTSFGDGLRCAGGSLERLYVKSASGGVATAPRANDPSISARSAALGGVITIGESRTYQVYYRDPSLSFCPPPQGDAWNVSSGLRIDWLP